MNEIERAMMDKLLPCPFCGGEATISDGGYSGEKFLVRCRELSCPAASGFIRKTHDEAIAAWNRRAQPENEPLTLDDICGALEEYRFSKTVSHFTYARDCESFRGGIEAAIALIHEMVKPERSEGGNAYERTGARAF